MDTDDRALGVAVPAAGSGRRLGGRKKAFLELLGEPLLLHALRPFLEHPRVASVVVALPAEEAADPPAWLRVLDPRIRLVTGGRTRAASVAAALEALGPDVSVAIVHDVARPLVSREIIDRCVRGVRAGEGALAGWPATDTLKEVDDDGTVVSTPDRSRIRRAQTPQAFPRGELAEAYRRALARGEEPTDDAAAFAGAGGLVRVVDGGSWNLKVTHPDDVPVAETLLRLRRERGGSGAGETRG